MKLPYPIGKWYRAGKICVRDVDTSNDERWSPRLLAID
jgi:hypothetical protein